MRFIVDESTGASVANLLRGLGHDVIFVGEETPQSADADILAQAVREDRIVVTNDKDFGELVYRHAHPHVGIVFLRLQDESAANRITVVRKLLERYAAQLPNHFVVVTETHIRIR